MAYYSGGPSQRRYRRSSGGAADAIEQTQPSPGSHSRTPSLTRGREPALERPPSSASAMSASIASTDAQTGGEIVRLLADSAGAVRQADRVSVGVGAHDLR